MVKRPTQWCAMRHFLGRFRCGFADYPIRFGTIGRGSFAGAQILSPLEGRLRAITLVLPV